MGKVWIIEVRIIENMNINDTAQTPELGTDRRIIEVRIIEV